MTDRRSSTSSPPSPCVSAALCILQRNPVSAALWLVSTMFSLAAIYVLLDAQFIAAIQVLVYAGAVMVLFLFVIMLLNLGHASSDIRGPAAVAATVVIVGLLVGELVALWRYTPRRLAARSRRRAPSPIRARLRRRARSRSQEAAARGVVGADRGAAVPDVPRAVRDHLDPAPGGHRRRRRPRQAEGVDARSDPSLGLSAILFTLGVAGVLLRRNAIMLFMCIELMLNAVNLDLRRAVPSCTAPAARSWSSSS